MTASSWPTCRTAPRGSTRWLPSGARPRPEDLRFPALTDEDCRYLERTSRAAYEGTSLGLTGEWHGKGLLGAGCLYAGGMESFLCDLLTDPGYAHAVLDRYTGHYLAQLPPFFQAVGRRLDVYNFYDDFGTQSAPLVSPGLFRDFFAPRYRRIIDAIKAASGCRIFFHSCGAVRGLIPDMIAMGVDCLNPVQPGPARHGAGLARGGVRRPDRILGRCGERPDNAGGGHPRRGAARGA